MKFPQADLADKEKGYIIDPLRGTGVTTEVSVEAIQDTERNPIAVPSIEAPVKYSSKEWTSFKKLLMQRFPASKMISISSVSVAFRGF